MKGSATMFKKRVRPDLTWRGLLFQLREVFAMPMNEEWVSGDYGRPIQVDTEITDLSPWSTYQIRFYDPLGALINTYTATNPSLGLLQYTPSLADTQTPDFLLIKSGVWKAIPVLSNAGTALLRSAQAMLINVKPEGKEGG